MEQLCAEGAGLLSGPGVNQRHRLPIGGKMMSRLTLSAYQDQAQRTDRRRHDDSSLAFPLLGLFGETGSLLSEVKKKQRDPVAYIGYGASVLEELGDVLWYLAAVSARANLQLDELAVNLDKTIADWQSTGAPDLRFDALEPPASGITAAPSLASSAHFSLWRARSVFL